MKEIRIHGRGGQGAVTAAELLAVAAFLEGKWCQAFPHFGVERRGAPVAAFTRIDSKQIRLHQQVYNPDYVIVLDASLTKSVNVAEGLKENGLIIINSSKTPKQLGLENNTVTVDATKIAVKEIGKPITNTTMLGAFAGATKEIDVESLVSAIKERFPEKLAKANEAAIRAAFSEVSK